MTPLQGVRPLRGRELGWSDVPVRGFHPRLMILFPSGELVSANLNAPSFHSSLVTRHRTSVVWRHRAQLFIDAVHRSDPDRLAPAFGKPGQRDEMRRHLALPAVAIHFREEGGVAEAAWVGSDGRRLVQRAARIRQAKLIDVAIADDGMMGIAKCDACKTDELRVASAMRPRPPLCQSDWRLTRRSPFGYIAI